MLLGVGGGGEWGSRLRREVVLVCAVVSVGLACCPAGRLRQKAGTLNPIGTNCSSNIQAGVFVAVNEVASFKLCVVVTATKTLSRQLFTPALM